MHECLLLRKKKKTPASRGRTTVTLSAEAQVVFDFSSYRNTNEMRDGICRPDAV